MNVRVLYVNKKSALFCLLLALFILAFFRDTVGR